MKQHIHGISRQARPAPAIVGPCPDLLGSLLTAWFAVIWEFTGLDETDIPAPVIRLKLC